MCMLDFHSDNSEKYECKQALLISFSAESVLHGKTFITELHDMINFWQDFRFFIYFMLIHL